MKQQFKTAIAIVIMLFACCNVRAQSGGFDAYGNIDKKTSDAALTRAMQNFQCAGNAGIDSVYSSLLTEYTSRRDIGLEITHRRYGSLPPEISMPLKDFICLFKKDFDFYCSIDEKDRNDLSVTIILKHKTFDYIHMLLAKTTRNALATGRPRVKADMYSFIPQTIKK
ncbi:MAG: hypothetical protein LBI58_02950 [Tannerellaceae bacterium]|jgi:hypothetical protein|nr:hypothetical protein [Tannerellaceae bacterium]